MGMRVAVSVGHHPDRPGFTDGQYSEHSEMAPVAGLLIQTLLYNGIKAYLVGTGPLDKKVQEINNLAPDVAIELHLNAGGGDGVETLYCPGSVIGKRLAETVNQAIVQLTGERDRGVKEGWYGMQVGGDKDYFLEHTNCPAVITEGFFLDQAGDRRDYAGNMDYYRRLAFAVASGLVNYRDNVMS